MNRLTLAAAAAILAALALRPGSEPLVRADTPQHHLFVEPGTTVIRDPDTGVQMQGKVVIDLRNGDVWGFPTDSSAPYPVRIVSKEAPTSRPLYLGRFDFSAMKK